MAKATGENGRNDIDSMFGDDMLDAALDDAISAAVSAGEEALAEVAASNARRNSEQIAVPVVTSGILDIKTLSESYEAERAATRAPTMGKLDEPVPMLGLGGAQSLHVLTPTSTSEDGGDRWLYFAFGFGSAFVLTAAVAVAVYFAVLRDNKKPRSPAVANQADVEQVVAANAPEPKTTPEPAAAPDPAAAPEPAATPEPKPEPEPTRPDPTPAPKKDTTKSSDERRGRADVPPAPAPTAPARPSGTCNEVDCLLDPSIPCCVKAGIGQPTSGPAKPVVNDDSGLPERPSRADVANAMRKIKGRVQSCADRNGFQGTVRIRITISPTGDVESGWTHEGPSDFKSCVDKVVGAATFPRSKKGITVTYPLLIK